MSSLLNILRDAHPITWIIIVAGIIAFIIVVERFLNLRRAEIDVQDFLPGVINTLRSQNVKEAIIICDETPGPASHVVREAIRHNKGGKEEMYRATRKAALTELPRLERMMKGLLTIVHVCPLLGLLGTVIGLLRMFEKMVGKNADAEGITAFMSVQQMAPDIRIALISTTCGLLVAIPCYMAYNFLRQKIDNILIEMEKAAVEIIYFLTLPEEEQSAQAGAPSPKQVEPTANGS